MKLHAATVEQYLAALPPDRRDAIQALRQVILKNLDRDYEEGIQYGMIGYYVPHRVFPAGYHCDPRQPLPFANLASQKNHMALYLMCAYGDGAEKKFLQDGFARVGKKLDMGKACIRFKRLDDLPLDVIGESVRRMPARKWVEICEAAIGKRAPANAKQATKPKKPAKSRKRAGAAKAARRAASGAKRRRA
ncbi:MAG: DUF1801 domain-containing protein [Phycisphaerae bacterium]